MIRHRSRTRGVAAQHASLSRWRSPVRIRSGPPSFLNSSYAPSARPDGASPFPGLQSPLVSVREPGYDPAPPAPAQRCPPVGRAPAARSGGTRRVWTGRLAAPGRARRPRRRGARARRRPRLRQRRPRRAADHRPGGRARDRDAGPDRRRCGHRPRATRPTRAPARHPPATPARRPRPRLRPAAPLVETDVAIVPVTHFRSARTSVRPADIEGLAGGTSPFKALVLVEADADAILAELGLDPAGPGQAAGHRRDRGRARGEPGEEPHPRRRSCAPTTSARPCARSPGAARACSARTGSRAWRSGR